MKKIDPIYKWVLDPTHSGVQFRIKHLMISTITGQFNHFEGTLLTNGDDFDTVQASFSADVNSISTNNEQRDVHLKTPEFFDVDNHPKLFFKSEKIEKAGRDTFKIHGLLTLKGVTREIILDAEFGGIATDNWGNIRVGYSLTGKIQRKDFGVNFGLLSEATIAMVSDEVKLFINAQFVKQIPAE